jgi:uncharacterized secreted protein with C-terminal beta-propeller domain
MTQVYALGLNEESSQLMQDLRSTIDSYAEEGTITKGEAERLKAFVPAHIRQHSELVTQYVAIADESNRVEFIRTVIEQIRSSSQAGV